MRKKHDYSALLKYMYMLEDGYSFNYIHTTYGINGEFLWDNEIRIAIFAGV